MKKIFLLAALLWGFCAFAKPPLIAEVRFLYQKASNDDVACKKIIEILSSYKNDALYSGYTASANIMMAKHVFSPFSKLSYFKKGKRMLEKSIEDDKDNVELRFLRFMIQTNIPSFLGYNDDTNGDKRFILNSYPHLTDLKLKEFMTPILKQSKYLTNYEKQTLE